jgi:uncharacterized LabA/DUF88 family protein
MSKSSLLPLGIISLVLAILLFVYQRKQNRQTLSLLNSYLMRLEDLESQTEELAIQRQPDFYRTVIKDKVKRLSTDVKKLQVTLNSIQPTPQTSPARSRRTVVFIDGNNIVIRSREKNLKIDFLKLKEQLTQEVTGEIELRYYTAVNPQSQQELQLIERQKQKGYKVIAKNLTDYPNHQVKGNLDAEIIRDMMHLSDQYDTAILLSADGDFSCIVEHLRQQQKRVELMCFRPASHELKQVAHSFTDLETLPIFQKQKLRIPEQVYLKVI